MAPVWWAVARAGDAVWMPDAPEPAFPADLLAEGFPEVEILSTEAERNQRLEQQPLSCCPWGWDAPILDWANAHKLATDHPPLEIVKHINSRRFSLGLEQELHEALPLATAVENPRELTKALAAFSPESGWVIKSEWGMSARERILGRGSTLSDSQANWTNKRFRIGESLIVEPWVVSLAESGLQFDVPRQGEGGPTCLGVTELLTNRSGMYQGSRFDDQAGREHDWSHAVAVGQVVAERVQALGYFGPLGLDAMWYRGEDCQPRLRPIQDLNARWTMGRLSLGFRRLLRPGEAGIWWHLRCPEKTAESAEAWWNDWKSKLPSQIRVIRTAPRFLGDQITHHVTVVLLTPNVGQIPALVEFLRS